MLKTACDKIYEHNDGLSMGETMAPMLANILAMYRMSFSTHFPSIGQVVFCGQLHVFTFCVGSCRVVARILRIFLLIFDFMFGKHE